MNLRTLTSPTLPPNRIYRSGVLTHVPAPSLSQLATIYNVRTIYDLRSTPERERAPSPAVEGVQTLWIPNTADGSVRVKDLPRDVPMAMFADGDGSEAWVQKYQNVLDMHAPVYKAVLGRLRDGGEGAILFHCTGGKDRTGVLAALILALCHTLRALIVHDYLLTRIGVEPFRDYLLKQLFGMRLEDAVGGETTQGLVEPGLLEMSEMRAATISGLLDWMDGRWGDEARGGREAGSYPGVCGWMIKELGFEAEDLEKIRRNLGVVD